jgi:hypothetical protein
MNNGETTMTYVRQIILLLLCISAIPVGLHAGNSPEWVTIHPHHFICPRAESPVQVDGVLSDSAWTAAPWSENFADIEGGRKSVPRFRTRVKMLWDDRYLYIGAELTEPQVWGTLTKRDTVIFYDNDFEVFIDPDGDNCEYGEFEMNALNTGWDLFLPKPYRDGGHPDDGWNIDGIVTAVHVDGTLNSPADTDRGWSVEIAMPWASLSRCSHSVAAPGDGSQWRINFSRVEWMTTVEKGHYHKVPGHCEDNWVWSPQGVVDMHRPEQWGYVQFTSKPVAEAHWRPDASIPAREALMTVYFAQRGYYERNKRWAGEMKDLGLDAMNWPRVVCCPILNLTPDGYEARVTLLREGGREEGWSVDQDSRLHRVTP